MRLQVDLWQEAPRSYFLGAEVYTWGLHVFFGALLCAMVVVFLCRRRKCAVGAAPLTPLMMLLCGFVCSRLLYCLTDEIMRTVLSLKAVFLVTGGGYSMFGALLGAMLGAFLSERILHEKRGRLMDMASLGLMLFMAAERLGEGCLEETGFGLSRVLHGDMPVFSFLMVTDEFGDSFLCTYKLESLFALVCFVLGMRRYSAARKRGEATLFLMIVWGAGQVLLESLRYDNHMRIKAFVGVQHILAYCVLTAGCAVYIARALKHPGAPHRVRQTAICLAAALPAVVALLVGLEFMIDRSAISNVLIYIVYILLLCAVAGAGLHLRNMIFAKEKRSA